MKKILLCISWLPVVLVMNAQSPEFKWAKSLGGNGSADEAYFITVDALGNVYTTGRFQTGDFDPGPGTYSLTAPSIPYGTTDVFVSKLDSSGNFVWAKNVGGNANDRGLCIKVDSSGNVYTTGIFSLTADFDPGVGTFSLSSAGGYDMFLSKLDASGNFVWAKRIGATGYDAGNRIVLDASGNILMIGLFQGTVDFDPGAGVFNLTSTANYPGFISKFDPQGNFVWAKSYNGNSGPGTIELDAPGNIFTTGSFTGTVDFDLGPGVFNLTAAGLYDTFISKMDAAGNFIWAKSMGDSLQEYCYGMALDHSGNIYTTGTFQGTTDLDPGPGVHAITSAGGWDLYISKLDMAGNFIWGKSIGGFPNEWSHGIAADSAGNVFITGYFHDTLDFDPGAGLFNLSSAGNFDIFILKLDASGNFAWAGGFGSANFDTGNAITLDKKNNIYTTGYFTSSCDFDPGAGVFNLSSNGYIDAFILKLGPCPPPAPPLDLTPLTNKLICENGTTTLSVSATGTISWFSGPTSMLVLNNGPAFITPPLAAGTYIYYAEAHTCTNSAPRTAVTFTVDACTGGENFSLTHSMLKIYPNPNNGLFGIMLNTRSTILVSNVFGKVILSIEYIDGNHNIDLRDQSNGIYFIKVVVDDMIITTQKIIKH